MLCLAHGKWRYIKKKEKRGTLVVGCIRQSDFRQSLRNTLQIQHIGLKRFSDLFPRSFNLPQDFCPDLLE